MADSRLSVHAGEPSLRVDSGRRIWRDAFLVTLVSVLLLVPCFWQSRIQAGDLSSHLYNAWLATLISQGKAPGLWIEHRSNNILFDVALQWLLQHRGAGVAQRIVVSAAVLIFGWGAIAFISAVAGRKNRWLILPWVWMLSYGFFYQMGFFNFYLSFGLCLWYLTIFWRGGWRMGVAASPLLILAWTAQPFPVVWAVGTAAYIAIARKLQPRQRLIILGIGVAVLGVARYVLMSRFQCRWFWGQALLVSGADQLLIFGLKYLYIVVPALLVAILLLIRLIQTGGWKELPFGMPFQLWVLNAAAVLLIPNDVVFPAYAVAFGYVANRFSLPAGVMACALLAQVPLRRYEKIAMIVIVAGFSAMLYADTRELNRWEDSVDARIAKLPSGQRVVSSLPVLAVPVDPLSHMVDRACLGHCYSYANYEPSTRQFRIRAGAGNGIVFSEYADVYGVEKAQYVVQPSDLPLSLIYACHPKEWEACVRPLIAGEVVHRGLGAAVSVDVAQAGVASALNAPALNAPAPSAPAQPDSQWDSPARRKVAAEGVHRRFGGDIYGTVDERYEGGPALVVHNKKANEAWVERFFTEGMSTPANEFLWKIGFRNYLVTNGTDDWHMDIEEDPKYRSLFQGPPPPVKR
jgi:hypothetical protein